MIKYGINVDLMKKLIDKLIMSKTDIFDSYEITMDDNSKRIYIFVTVYFDNRKLASFEKEYYENQVQQYGDLDNVPDYEYEYCDEQNKGLRYQHLCDLLVEKYCRWLAVWMS